MAAPRQKIRYHHGNLPEALLDAGETALSELGAHKLTLRECARRAGVSHAAPTHHFGNRTQFLSALAERGFRRLARAVMTARAAVEADELDAQLLATAEAYVGFAREYPELFRLMFRLDLLEHCETVVSAAQATFLELTNVIRQQRGEPPLDSIDGDRLPRLPALMADVMMGWCHIHGLAHLLIEGQFDSMKGDDEQAFVAAVLTHTAPRLGRLLRSGKAPGSGVEEQTR